MAVTIVAEKTLTHPTNGETIAARLILNASDTCDFYLWVIQTRHRSQPWREIANGQSLRVMQGRFDRLKCVLSSTGFVQFVTHPTFPRRD